jgi:hypothetical protein
LTYDEKDWEDYTEDSSGMQALEDFSDYISNSNGNINFNTLQKYLNKVNFADFIVGSESFTEYGNPSITSYQFLLLSILIAGLIILNTIFFAFELKNVIKLDKKIIKIKLVSVIFLINLGTIFTYYFASENVDFFGINVSGPFMGGALIFGIIFNALIIGMSFTGKLIENTIKIRLKKFIFASITAVLAFIVGFAAMGRFINIKAETEDSNYYSYVSASDLIGIIDEVQDDVVFFKNDLTLIEAFPSLTDIYNNFATETSSITSRIQRNSYFMSYTGQIITTKSIVTNNLAMFILLLISCFMGYAVAILMVFSIKYLIKSFFEKNDNNIFRSLLFTGIAALCMIASIVMTAIFASVINGGSEMHIELINVIFSINLLPIFVLVLLGGMITLDILYLKSGKKIIYID